MTPVGRVLGALILSLALIVGAYLTVLVGTGQYLDDRCFTHEFGSGWVPQEFEIIRGPTRDGPISYRCEAVGDPERSFTFIDPLPTLGTVFVAHTALGLVVLAWVAAVPTRARPRSG